MLGHLFIYLFIQLHASFPLFNYTINLCTLLSNLMIMLKTNRFMLLKSLNLFLKKTKKSQNIIFIIKKNLRLFFKEEIEAFKSQNIFNL